MSVSSVWPVEDEEQLQLVSGQEKPARAARKESTINYSNKLLK